jgi:Fic family protein
MKSSGNLWYHQKEQKDVEKQRQKMFLEGLNEQRKLEKQRQKIDKKFEVMTELKIRMDQDKIIKKEDQEKNNFRCRFEQASRTNDMRINHYLSNYYQPTSEKALRSEDASGRTKATEETPKRKIRVMKKKKNVDNRSMKV